MNDHAADHGRGALQFGELIYGDVRVVSSEIGAEALAPGRGLLAAFVGEADGEDEVLLAARFGDNDFGIVEGFAFDGRDGLRRTGRYSEKDQRENGGEKFEHRHH